MPLKGLYQFVQQKGGPGRQAGSQHPSDQNCKNRLFADGSVGNGDQRNGGIENAIQAIQDLSSHIGSQLSVAGSQSQVLERTIERTELLIVTTKSLRSEAIDTDMAEAALELKQLEINYQAMLSTVSRISQLTLVNYL